MTMFRKCTGIRIHITMAWMSAWILAGILAIAPSLTQANVDQTYRFMMEEEPRNLSTIFAGDIYVEEINELTHAHLLRFDREGYLQPDLAEHWEMSRDGKTIILYLRKDAKFHDGSTVDANDVVATLTYLANPIHLPRQAERVFSIAGAEAYYKGEAKQVSGLTAIDAHTVSLTLNKPDRLFIFRMAGLTVFSILPADNLNLGQQNIEHPDSSETPVPIGAGAYIIKKWNRGESMLLERSPHYHDADSIRIPRIEILFKTHPMFKQTTQEQAFLDGKLDHIYVDADMHDLNKLAASGDSPFDVVQLHSSYYYLYGMQNKKPPLDDVRVRQALNYIYDNESVNNDELPANYQPLYGLLMPRMPGYKATPYYSLNLEKARELLAEAGYADLDTFPELVLGSIEDDFEKTRAQKILSQQLQAFGIRTRLVNFPGWDEYLTAILNKELHIYPYYYSYGLPRVEVILLDTFHSKGRFNTDIDIQDEKLDQLIDETIIQQGKAAQIDAVLKVEEELMKLAPIIPRFTSTLRVAFNPRIKHPTPGWFRGYSLFPLKDLSFK